MPAEKQDAPRIRYELTLPRPQDHLVEVSLAIEGLAGDGPLELAMAAWSPGSYLIRDYARYVRGLTSDRGALTKVDKHTWRLDPAGADRVVVRYAVYGHDLTVRTNHIDDTHAFLHGPATLLYAPAFADRPCAVTVRAPDGWQTHCGLAGGPIDFTAVDVDELLDCPIHVGRVEAHEFRAAGKPTRLVLWGEREPGGVAGIDDLIADLRAVIDAHAARFGGAPYDQYTFLLMLTPDGYGGLEHRNSSANLNTPFAFATRKSYEDLLELLSHEFFHVWNGKRIRPAALGPFDYGAESYTRSLWVQEGITSYIDRFTLRRAGCQSPKRYLDKLADEWGKLRIQPGRALHSLEEASFDAWIKLYKPDESNINTTVSYYLKGAFVALALDHEIRERSGGARSIDDVLRRLWERYGTAPRGYEDGAVQAEVEAAAGVELGEFFDRYVRGTEDPDFAGLLARCGLELTETRDPKPNDGAERAPVWLGVMLENKRTLRAVLDGSPAQLAGLAPRDELLAVDGFEITSEATLRQRLAARAPGDEVSVALFRRGRLRTLAVRLAEAPPNRYEIATLEAPADEQRARYEQWLGEPYPDEPVRAGATVSTWL